MDIHVFDWVLLKYFVSCLSFEAEESHKEYELLSIFEEGECFFKVFFDNFEWRVCDDIAFSDVFITNKEVFLLSISTVNKISGCDDVTVLFEDL